MKRKRPSIEFLIDALIRERAMLLAVINERNQYAGEQNDGNKAPSDYLDQARREIEKQYLQKQNETTDATNED